ncbi:MAG: ATP synthase F1 subunit delta [Clostridia bacterium]|nr:ATP synthase F1 subunit delta [Clostridia bacterium]
MTRIGSVYAEALYGLAKDEGISEKVLSEMETLAKAFETEPDFIRLLSAPSISKDERCGIIDNSFAGKVEPYVLNFLKILTEKGYMGQFGDCCSAFRRLYHEDNGILSVKVVTAVALTDAQSEKLSAKLAKMTGKKILLDRVVDPSCMGGVRLDYDGMRVDDTIQHRLDSLRNLLKNTIL